MLSKYKNHLVYGLGGSFVIFMMVFGAGLGGQGDGSMGSSTSPFGRAQVPPHIEKWRSLVFEYTTKNGIPEYTDFLLALMYQEIGSSQTLDIMQSSESLGLPPNALQDPVRSVEAGVAHFKKVLETGQKAGVDFATTVQSYNFGSGYINFIAGNGKVHSQELAKQFSLAQVQKLGWSTGCSGNRSPYCYGDFRYVDKVMKNLVAENGMIPIMGGADTSPLGEDKYKLIMTEAYKYLGHPYSWAGYTPSMGFDCSGITQWTYKLAGINLPRTAQEQYDFSSKISAADAKPGDLVFFTGTYSTNKYITHVGIYMGNGQMYNSKSSGIGVSSLSESFWKKHMVGFGRVAK